MALGQSWRAAAAIGIALAAWWSPGAFAMGREGSGALERSTPGRPALPPASLVSRENPQQAAILRHEVDVRLDPATGGCTGTDRLTLLHAPGVPMDQPFSFLLWKDLKIEEVRLDPEELRPAVRGGRTDTSPRGFTVEERERMNPRAFWRRPPYDQLAGYEKARQVDLRLEPPFGTWPETLRVLVSWSGTLVDSLRPPDAAYARSFEETSGLIESRGAFLSGASFWIPSRPGDTYTFRLRAAVPQGWRAVSQGRLVPGDEARADFAPPPGAGAAPLQIDVWDCPQPMEEIYLVAGPWTLRERPHGDVQVQTFTYAQTDTSICERYLDGTGRYLDLYEERIGPYPFAKFALVENFWQTGFGMPSFTLLGDRVIRLPFILDTSYGHEILHNWWGNGVFVDYESGNWCEGLTTYQADYFYREREGEAAARDYRRNALASYLDYVSADEDEPLSRFTGRHDAATQAIGYSKSLMVIHQLRRMAGDERFGEALRLFYQRQLWRRATWDDLLACFRDVAGLDPENFRRQWVDRAGAPTVSVRDVVLEPEGNRWRVRATLAQGRAFPADGGAGTPGAAVNAGSPGGSGGPSDATPYSLVVPVRLEWAGGDSTWQVPLAAASKAWSAVVDAPPKRLLIDPEFEMLRRIDRSEIPPTLSQTLGADTVMVVIASGLSPEVEEACRSLAATWARGQALTVIDEHTQPKGWQPAASAWYLGLGPAAKARLSTLREVRIPQGPRASTDASLGAAGSGGSGGSGGTAGAAGPDPWRIGEQAFLPTSHSFVLCGHDAGDSGGAWTVIAPADAATVAAIGDKVPHYGKYSYLVLEGTRVTAKGVWAESPSPLVVELASGQGLRRK